MSLIRTLSGLLLSSAPRVSGDEPDSRLVYNDEPQCSPRERG